MSKNLIPEIAQMLGVKLGEKFKIKGDDELMTYSFNSDGLQVTYGDDIEIPISSNLAFVDLVNGKDEIVKLPWKPKPGEYYYTYNSLWEIINVSWRDDLYDLCWQKLELVFRTEEEALKERSRIYKEWTGEEWEE